MQNILIVGGAGYIGSHCVREVLAAGMRPVVLDNLCSGYAQALPGSVREHALHVGEMGDIPFVRSVLVKEKIDAVMHFAAHTAVAESVSNPLKYYHNNVGQTVGLLQAMQAEGVGKLIFSSTAATYGVQETLPIKENAAQKPFNTYGQTKLDVENILKSCAQNCGLSFAAFRYFNAAGALPGGEIGAAHKPLTHLIPLIIQSAQGLRGPLQIFGTNYPTPDGTAVRDYIHVCDLARAHIAALGKLGQPGAQHIYNLGTGTAYSVKEMVGFVEEVTGLSVPVEEAPRRPGDVPAIYADSTLAQTELNWTIEYPHPRDIIATAWQWHKQNPHGYA